MSRMIWREDPVVADQDSGDIVIDVGGSSGTQDIPGSEVSTTEDPD
jgi:hypothetical protein